MEKIVTAEVGGKTLTISTGKVAKQAGGSVVVQYGETVVLVTVVAANEERAASFLPLSVEYQEKSMPPGESQAITSAGKLGAPAKKRP
jgi:polyribonucleotide nucleotidyltransferase